MWIDSHCHLQLTDREGSDGSEIPSPADYVHRAQLAGVEKLICVGTDPESSREAIAIASAAGDAVFATIGLHPHDADRGMEETIALTDETIAISDNRVVAIGETGLDYFYEHSPVEIQKSVFIEHIELARKYDLPLVVHTRNAWDDTFAILRSEGAPPRTVLHCFTGGTKEIRIALELGFYVSFSGIVTFKNATKIQEAARFCPLDRMIIETDSPFLTPVPYRGRPNEPAYIGVIGEYISALKDTQVRTFAEAVSMSTKQVFGLNDSDIRPGYRSSD